MCIASIADVLARATCSRTKVHAVDCYADVHLEKAKRRYNAGHTQLEHVVYENGFGGSLAQLVNLGRRLVQNKLNAHKVQDDMSIRKRLLPASQGTPILSMP